MIMLADSVVPDQTAQMRRLIWAFAVRRCSKIHFRMVRTNFSYNINALRKVGIGMNIVVGMAQILRMACIKLYNVIFVRFD